MSEVLLAEIQFNSKTWYLSEEGYIGENYYAPYLASTPTLELGEVKGGYIGVRLGDLSIANRPNDRNSPFSIFAGGYSKLLANPNQKIPIQIYWKQDKISSSLFDGSMYLSGFDTDAFNFLLEDKIADVDLLSFARDFDSDLSSINSISITGEGVSGTALVSAPDHELETGDFIRVSECPTTAFNTFDSDKNEIINVKLTKVDDNFFRYTLINGNSTDFRRSFEYTMETYTKKPQPFSFGYVVRKKDIIKIDERQREFLGDYSGEEFSNPDLKHDDPNYDLLMYDDGVLVGSKVSSRFGNLINGINVVSVIKNGDYIEIATGDNQLQTGTPHNLEAGSTIKLIDFSPDNINDTFLVVAEIINDYEFKVYLKNIGQYSAETTYSITTGVSKIKTPGEYYGVSRLPTAEKIYTRALFTEQQAYNSSDPATVTTLGGVDYTSFDGTNIYGTVLVSGMSSNGESLSEFLEYIARKAGVTNVDFTEAPDASSIKLQIWETSQTKAVEFAGEVAYAANHLFEIRNDILRVIDRSYQPSSFIRINNWEIIEASYKMPTPVKALRTKWRVNVINPKTTPNSLTTKEESVMISNMASGEILDIIPVSETPDVVSNLLFKIRDTINKNIITIKVGRIRTDIIVGSRIKANRDEDGVTIDMIVRTINYDFGDMSTEVVGDGSLVVIEQDQIY